MIYFIWQTPQEMKIDLRETLKLNKMDKWFEEFHKRIEKVVID